MTSRSRLRRSSSAVVCLLVLSSLVGCAERPPATTEFCLDGRYDIGVRNQGTLPERSEPVETRWCVVTEDDGERVRFSSTGKVNPDYDDSFTIAYLPPDLVRIVNRESPPDVEFRGTESLDDARRHRRIDPRRLVEMRTAEQDSAEAGDFEVEIVDGRVSEVGAWADLPLRGRVLVVWKWNWPEPDAPSLVVEVDGEPIFHASGAWRELSVEEAAAVWQVTPGADPVEVPGSEWPARVNMRVVEIEEGVVLVRGVRTGFQHLAVDTAEGLVVADAPAGWVELHQIPPTDLVPGLGISGLSEQLVDFLGEQYPERPIRAVALTHAHDDHAGGARAFAAEGAEVYAPEEVAGFLDAALDRGGMPEDRLAQLGETVAVQPVSGVVRLDDPNRPVELHSLGAGPHAAASLAIYLPRQKVAFVSDVHVPSSEDPAPLPERAPTECWFASWAVEHLPEDVRVFNSHSAPETPVRRLEEYLESEACRDLS